jgi:hypothetical protein
VRILIPLVCSVALTACTGRDERTLPLDLPRDPFLGLKCVSAAPCERVGVAVWVRRRMKSVNANIRGHSIVLHRASNDRGPYRRGLFWEGVLRDHGAERAADAFPTRWRVEIVAVDPDGKKRSRIVDVPVSSGYG